MSRWLLLMLLLATGPASAQSKEAIARSLIEDDAVKAKKTAAQLGARTQDKRAWWSLTQALAMGVSHDVAPAILAAIGKHQRSESAPILTHYVLHKHPKVRAAAFSAWLATDEKAATEIIAQALADGDEHVRDWGLAQVDKRNLKKMFPTVLVLLEKGSPRAAKLLAKHGDATTARDVHRLRGKAPSQLVAQVLGDILLKKSLKDERDRVRIVRMLGRTPGADADKQLQRYVAAIPKDPPRLSRREAVGFLKARKGDKQ